MDYNNNLAIKWPTYSINELDAAQRVIENGEMSGLEISKEFEIQFSKWLGVKYTLSCCNGTAALLEALWAIGVEEGDEVIAPAMTYWASALPVKILGAKIVWVDIDPTTLCIDVDQVAEAITNRTKAIIAVHLYGHPCNMNKLMQLSKEKCIYVIEDFSHAHGALYNGNKVGSIGHIGIASCMTEKPLPLGEAGVVCTNNRELYERAMLFGHYRRSGYIENGEVRTGSISNTDLIPYVGIPIGCIKNRMNQVSAAIGLERLGIIDKQIEEINTCMNYFLDGIEKRTGIRGHRIVGENMSMGGWYSPKAFFPESTEFSAGDFCEALGIRGYNVSSGHKYFFLPNHPVTDDADYIRHGGDLDGTIKMQNDLYKLCDFPGIESSNNRLIEIPRFVKFEKDIINKYIELYVETYIKFII